MQVVLVLLHVVACMALILIVLLQTGRGAEMGAAFGGASQTLFGSSGGTTFLGKLTTGAAVVFMLTCLSLSYLTAKPPTSSVMDQVDEQKPQGPALPEAKPVPPAAPVEQQSSSTAPAQSAGTPPSVPAAVPQEPAKAEPAAPAAAAPSAEPAKADAPAKAQAPAPKTEQAPAAKKPEPAAAGKPKQPAPAAKPAAKDKP